MPSGGTGRQLVGLECSVSSFGDQATGRESSRLDSAAAADDSVSRSAAWVFMSDFIAFIFLPRECHRCQNAAMPRESTRAATASPMAQGGRHMALMSTMDLALAAEMDEFADAHGHDTFLYRACQTTSRGTEVKTRPRRNPRMNPLLSDPWV